MLFTSLALFQSTGSFLYMIPTIDMSVLGESPSIEFPGLQCLLQSGEKFPAT